MKVYDNKCVISTEPGVGNFLRGTATDGEKTIFYIDVIGVQFKRSGIMVGYLQLEIGSMLMKNTSNEYSENSFPFANGENGITNEFMEQVYHYIVDRIEGYKYGTHR